ncbi:MAG: sigma-70 family RNA polymerase sigma factor [Clostridia bacterium]|nr:sigma-70 family RNA polymerase sigma factor [Clostridia bacterium]
MLQYFLSTIEDPLHRSNFKEIYFLYRQKMMNITYKYLKKKEDAEDALQDAFAGIVQNIHKLKDPTSIETEIYVCKAAKNAAISILRKQKHFENIEDCYALASDDNIEQNAITTDLYERVMRYIKTMPPQYIDVLTLHLVHNMTAKEIAISLHRPYNTVRSSIYRGLKMLQENFPEEYNGKTQK